MLDGLGRFKLPEWAWELGKLTERLVQLHIMDVHGLVNKTKWTTERRTT